MITRTIRINKEEWIFIFEAALERPLTEKEKEEMLESLDKRPKYENGLLEYDGYHIMPVRDAIKLLKKNNMPYKKGSIIGVVGI